MEKIYEEKGKKKQSFFQQFFNDKGSMVAVIVVAVVAVVGLIAFGFNQISFAADEIGGDASLEEKYTSVYGSGNNLVGTGGYKKDGEFHTIDSISFIPYQMARSVGTAISAGKYVICVDFMTDFKDGEEYLPSTPVLDGGLIYLMTELDRVLASADEELAYWLKQTTIWAYLYDSETPENLAKDPARAALYKNIHDNVKWVNTIESDSGILYEAASDKGSFWAEYGISPIYDAAVQGNYDVSVPGYDFDIDVTRENDKMSLSGDGKYYVTSNYSVISKSDMFDNYYLELSGTVPEGTRVYSENGKEIDINNEIPSTTKFKLMIPVDKVNDKNKNFNVSVYSDYMGEGLVNFINPTYQTVIDKGPVVSVADDSIAVKVNYTPDVPDTGMTTAQTIYFIGLIILLGGVGIIYANAKPQENN